MITLPEIYKMKIFNPSFPAFQVTVQTQLRRRFPDLVNPKLGHEFMFAHRLDFATSGLMCISVHKKAAGAVTKCFVHKRVDKYYLALVRGHVSKEMLDIYLPIGEHDIFVLLFPFHSFPLFVSLASESTSFSFLFCLSHFVSCVMFYFSF